MNNVEDTKESTSALTKKTPKSAKKSSKEALKSFNEAIERTGDQGVQIVDEYADYDSSDEEEIRNTVGNVPMEWYKDYEHIGYNLDGKKILKPQQMDELDEFLDKMDNPDYWRTVKDKLTGMKINVRWMTFQNVNLNPPSRILKGWSHL